MDFNAKLSKSMYFSDYIFYSYKFAGKDTGLFPACGSDDNFLSDNTNVTHNPQWNFKISRVE